MITHYLKIAIRVLARQKKLAIINVLGLSIGLACFSLFLLYAVNEFRFDRFHKNGKNIYRAYIWVEELEANRGGGGTYLPMPLGPAMQKDLPGIENYVRIQEGWLENFVKSDAGVTREKMSFADPSFFEVFSFPLVSGNPASVLKDQRSVVLTEKIAKKLFGNTNPVGKTISVKLEESFEPFIVSGVAKNIPSNSTIGFDIIGNFGFLEQTEQGKRGMNNWNRSSIQTYVTIKPGSKVPDRRSMVAFRKKYYPKEEEDYKKEGKWDPAKPPVWYGLQPLFEMHTNPAINGGTVDAIKPFTVWLLLGIAGAVLLIACINFTTLAIGRSSGRAKEVGVRKVIGGRKKELIFQFMMEAVLLSIASAITGFILANLLLPYFNQLSGRELKFSFSQYPMLIWLLIVISITALLSGSYPALVLSRFNPIMALKSKIKVGGSNLFTKSLVTLQFVLSVGLIISTVIIIEQVSYMRSKNPGFNKENIVVVDASGLETKKIYPLFRQAALSHPGIVAVAGSELGIGEGTGWSRSGFDYNGKHKDVFEYYVDDHFLPLMNMQLLRGRNFDPSIASDTLTSVIINEAMANDFGWTMDNAVGQQIKGYSERMTPVVIGVVKNFNYRSLSEKIEPQMFHQFADYQPFKFWVKIQKGDPANSLAVLRDAWKSSVPEMPFKYSFLDEDLNRFYNAETRWSNIIGWAGGISIFLACLGLLGLAALATVNRTKEIGIRKVLGASASTIIGLLSKDFLKLVIIAFCIASPLAWYFMHQWLEGFAYRISISGWIFVFTCAAAVIIAVLTIGLQAGKAALANPVKSLRTE